MRTGSWLGLDSNLKKGLSWFAAGHPVCFLVISTSSFPPTKQLRLNPTSKYCRLSGGTAHTAQNTSPRMKKRNIDLLPIKSARRRVYFGIPALLSPSPPLIGTCFLSTCTPYISQRILFPFLRGGDRMLKMDKASPFWKNPCAHTYTHLRSLSTLWSI